MANPVITSHLLFFAFFQSTQTNSTDLWWSLLWMPPCTAVLNNFSNWHRLLKNTNLLKQVQKKKGRALRVVPDVTTRGGMSSQVHRIRLSFPSLVFPSFKVFYRLLFGHLQWVWFGNDCSHACHIYDIDCVIPTPSPHYILKVPWSITVLAFVKH